MQENRNLFAWLSYYAPAMRQKFRMKAFSSCWTVITNNRLYTENLTWQVESLANWTKAAINAVDSQLQATSKMMLQNMLDLDIILLKENGVLWMVKRLLS